MVILGILCVTGSFAIGAGTAGDMKAIAPMEANESVITSDMNGNGHTDLEDVTIILEIVKGYRVATPQQLRADPNNDGNLTIDDAPRMLRDMGNR